MSDLNQLTDAELSAAFAVEVAGFTKIKNLWVTPGGIPKLEVHFATSMDAVLPYLAARSEYCEIRYGHGLWLCLIGPNELGISSYSASTSTDARKTTMPRAACCALILAARAEKEASK